jgi:hypothetical protein
MAIQQAENFAGTGNVAPVATPEPAAPTTRLATVDSEPPSFYENGQYRSNPKYHGFARNMTALGLDAYFDQDPTTGQYKLKSQLPGVGDRTTSSGALPSTPGLGSPAPASTFGTPAPAQQQQVAGGYIFSQNPQINPKGVVSA